MLRHFMSRHAIACKNAFSKKLVKHILQIMQRMLASKLIRLMTVEKLFIGQFESNCAVSMPHGQPVEKLCKSGSRLSTTWIGNWKSCSYFVEEIIDAKLLP